MTDKEKQIEDMANCKSCYERFGKCPIKDRATCLDYTRAVCQYEQGCRIISEGSVVLSKEEYNALLLEQKRLKEMVDRIPCGYSLTEQSRKETAREILKELYEQIDEKTPKWVETQIKMKAKQFGVEVGNDR